MSQDGEQGTYQVVVVLTQIFHGTRWVELFLALFLLPGFQVFLQQLSPWEWDSRGLCDQLSVAKEHL